MASQAAIDRAVQRLEPILRSIKSRPDDDLARIARARDSVLGRYGTLFRPEKLESLTEEQFREFLKFENNKHWPLHRQAGALCADMGSLRRALSVLLDESRPIAERLNEVRDPDGPLRILGLGKGILTAVLHVAHPDRYSVWNSTTQKALKSLDIWPSMSSKDPFGDRYVEVDRIVQKVADAIGTDLWTVDALWWRYENEAVEGGEDQVRDDGEHSYGTRSSEAEAPPTSEGDVAEIADAARRFIPDSEVALRIWRALGECVEEVARHGPAKWSLSKRPNWFTLNAGRLMVFSVGREDCRVSLSSELLTDEQRSRLEADGSWGRPFKSAPDVHVLRLPTASLAALFDTIREPLFDAIRTGAQIRQTPYFAAHSPAAITWLERELGRELPRPSYQTPYWKIAPGAGAGLWEQCRDGGYIAVGWPALGNLAGLSEAEYQERARAAAETHDDYKPAGMKQVWEFSRIPIGSYIVANRGTAEVVGIGKVTSEYAFVEGDDYPHRLPVDWFDTNSRSVNQPGWKRTVIPLQRSAFERIRDAGPGTEQEAAAFTHRTFELLEELRAAPNKETYFRLQGEIQSQIEAPLQTLMQAVARDLPAEATEILETEKRVFARILKNDFGRGGAWDYYWGAFYPKGRRRVDSAQLWVWINAERLEYGFGFGAYQERGTRTRLLLDEADESVREAIETGLGKLELVFGTREDLEGGEAYSSLEDWLGYSDAAEPPSARRVLTRDEVLELSPEELVEDVSQTFAGLLPLMLLSVHEDPWPVVRDYLDVEEPSLGTAPAYSVADLRAETGFAPDQIQHWVRVLRRKKQVILQGPPGTGKTFVAQRLARLLVSETPGAWDVVQFHPAYAYEDFMQGIRPEVTEGALSYDLEAGQFLRFCERAQKAEDHPCVLIIDEINRANLARVFGELMYLLEYRDKDVTLAAGGSRFQVPENVHIIGTMNTADRSITRMDHAMRRRFAFIRLRPEYEVLRAHLDKHVLPAGPLVDVLKALNREIDDPNYEVGISYFMAEGDRLRDHAGDIWRGEIEPYLDEYFYDQPQRVAPFRWSKLLEGKLSGWA